VLLILVVVALALWVRRPYTSARAADAAPSAASRVRLRRTPSNERTNSSKFITAADDSSSDVVNNTTSRLSLLSVRASLYREGTMRRTKSSAHGAHAREEAPVDAALQHAPAAATDGDEEPAWLAEAEHSLRASRSTSRSTEAAAAAAGEMAQAADDEHFWEHVDPGSAGPAPVHAAQILARGSSAGSEVGVATTDVSSIRCSIASIPSITPSSTPNATPLTTPRTLLDVSVHEETNEAAVEVPTATVAADEGSLVRAADEPSRETSATDPRGMISRRRSSIAADL
jgi:hypothetical protein